MSDVVNQTEVCVVWGPSAVENRGVLQVTLKIGKNRSREDDLMVAKFLEAIRGLQSLRRPV